jgi:uncharacterized membrane protein
METTQALMLQIAAGIALAACAGLRAFLPLFITGIAARLGWVSLSPSWEWLGSWPALVIFGVAVVTETLGDKIPVVDHVLDLLQSVVKPAAGTILAASLLTELGPLSKATIAIIAGGGTAAMVHLVKAKLRVLSTAVTAGLGNPLLSLGEDVLAFVGTIGALVIPILMVCSWRWHDRRAARRPRFRQRAARFGH